MTIPSRDRHTQECVIDLPTGLAVGDLHLDDYLLKSKLELDAIAELADRGLAVDGDSREWMLAQVDFIVETIGNENLELDDVLRSNMLQLLLAIANLNEQIRHQASLAL
jgi:hypothetical protein